MTVVGESGGCDGEDDCESGGCDDEDAVRMVVWLRGWW